MKKALLWMPDFFDYKNIVIKELSSRGYLVDYVQDRPFKKDYLIWLTRVMPKLMTTLCDIFFYRKKIFKKYDLVLVINGQTLSNKIYKKIKESSPNAKNILYVWDSLNNRKHIQETFKNFEKVFSFDYEDSKNHNLIYRPLFFIEPERQLELSTKNKQDLCFVGTVHKDRLKVLNKIIENHPDKRFYAYKYIPSLFLLLIKMIFNKEFKQYRINDFKLSAIPIQQVYKKFSESRIIIDIPHSNQSGLTIRTLEALALDRKIATTNLNIKKEKFYNTNNIFIIDRRNPKVPNEFFDSDIIPVKSDIKKYYSISGWLDELIGN